MQQLAHLLLVVLETQVDLTVVLRVWELEETRGCLSLLLPTEEKHMLLYSGSVAEETAKSVLAIFEMLKTSA